MTRRRWIADEFSLTPAGEKSASAGGPGADRAALTGAHAAHLARTLRARVGQEFEVVCGDRVRRGTIASLADDRVEFALGEEVPARAAVPITLLLAVFKFDRMEWAIEKCTELNVTSIVPVISRRTEKHLAAAAEKRVERWRRIAREASEQSRRVTPPQIATPMKLREARGSFGGSSDSIVIPTEDFSPSGRTCGSSAGALKIVLAESEREASLADVLDAPESIASLALAVGPEGGWTEEELRGFADSGWKAASLGETILRAETAAIAALAIARIVL